MAEQNTVVFNKEQNSSSSTCNIFKDDKRLNGASDLLKCKIAEQIAADLPELRNLNPDALIENLNQRFKPLNYPPITRGYAYNFSSEYIDKNFSASGYSNDFLNLFKIQSFNGGGIEVSLFPNEPKDKERHGKVINFLNNEPRFKDSEKLAKLVTIFFPGEKNPKNYYLKDYVKHDIANSRRIIELYKDEFSFFWNKKPSATISITLPQDPTQRQRRPAADDGIRVDWECGACKKD